MKKMLNRPGSLKAYSVLLLTVVAAATALSSATLAIPAAGETAPPVKIELWGEVFRGDEAVRLGDDVRVNPGEEIVWRLRLHNSGQKWVAGVRAVGDIPAGTRFVEGSAGGEGVTGVEYSIDGGKTFSPRPVVIKDGKPVPAPVSSYTTVRLTFGGRVESGMSKTASYRTLVL